MSKLEVYSSIGGWKDVCNVGGLSVPLHIYDGGFPHRVKSGDWVWANSQWNMLCPIALAWVITDIDDDLDSSDGEIQRKRHRNLTLSRVLNAGEQVDLLFDWELIGGMSPISIISEATIDISSGSTTGDIEKNGNYFSQLQFKNGTKNGQIILTLTQASQQYRLCTRAFYSDPGANAVGEVRVNLTLVSATGTLVGVEGNLDVTEFISDNDF